MEINRNFVLQVTSMDQDTISDMEHRLACARQLSSHKVLTVSQAQE